MVSWSRMASLFALGTFLASLLLYCVVTSEGRGLASGIWQALSTPKVLRLSPREQKKEKTAVLHWLAADGLWSVAQATVTADNRWRIGRLANLVIERLGLDLLVSRGIVGSDGIVYLFFAAGEWQPAASDEVRLGQSLVRTLLRDQPWLAGVRLVLKDGHLDYSWTWTGFSRGVDPLLKKGRNTLEPRSLLEDPGRARVRELSARSAGRKTAPGVSP